MNYKEALQYIHNTAKFGSKLGLKNITELLNRLENPHKGFPSVHVAGTNGKGSVTAMTAQILYQAGYRVGMFVSPYLERFTERIQVNFEEIPKEDLACLTGQVKNQVEGMIRDGFNHPTEFEVVTALGFLWFARQEVDIAVVEVGLGGRLDSTNVIQPLISVITSISYDHTRILGNTLSEIAFEKGGIMKTGVPVVSYPQHQEAEKVLKSLAEQRGCTYYPVLKEQVCERDSTLSVQHFDFTFGKKTWKNLTIHLAGKHQLLNAACVLTCIQVLKDRGLHITDEAIHNGLEKARWPGRMELVEGNLPILLDGAHNSSGAQALVDAVRLYIPDTEIYLILGVLQDKDVETVTALLCSIADHVMITRSESPRSAFPKELAAIAAKHHRNISISSSVAEAIDHAMNWVQTKDEDRLDQLDKKMVIISGSLYLVGEAKTILRDKILLKR